MAKIMIELIHAENDEMADLLTQAAKEYWEDPFYGYTLTSDRSGPDTLNVRKGGGIDGKSYKPGKIDYSDGDVIVLVFEKKNADADDGSKAKDKKKKDKE